MSAPIPLGTPVIARINGTTRPAEIRGHCHKIVDLYDVRTDDGVIHLYLRAEQLAPLYLQPTAPVALISASERRSAMR